MLRIENSNYNKEGSEFFVAGAAATGRAMDGSMIGWLPRVGLGRGTAGAPAGWLYGCKQAGTQAGRQAGSQAEAERSSSTVRATMGHISRTRDGKSPQWTKEEDGGRGRREVIKSRAAIS